MEAVRAAFITGVNGQDGSYLSELLLEKGYEVYGIIRRKANPEVSTMNIDHLRGHKNFHLHHGDLMDSGCLMYIMNKIFADNNVTQLEVYNLAALSHVKVSFENPEYCGMVNGIGTLKLLEAIRLLPPHCGPKIRFYQASTSELYGKVLERPQNENTPFNPVSPYAASKLYAYYLVRNYREAYGIFACNGILFNHESPRRGMDFVTRKVTVSVANISNGLQSEIRIGNLDSVRDWGHARDFVRAMWLILQQQNPDDFVIATGVTHTVREFIEKAFNCIGKTILWEGKGLCEVGIDAESRQVIVRVDETFFRPVEVDFLHGDSNKAQKVLGWINEVSFDELVHDMVQNDLKEVGRALVNRSGQSGGCLVQKC